MPVKDSVFSEYASPFPDDKTITPEAKIASDLNKIESIASLAFTNTYNRALDSAIAHLSSTVDLKSINNYRWNLSSRLSNNLFGEWLLGWQSGSKTGNKEIRSPALFAQPKPESAILRNRAAEDAIKSRINTLASDVSNSEWNAIKLDILDAIAPQSKTENPISRRQLLARINDKLGDRKNRFKNRAETIARTELTFAYNAGRLDSYVRSGLVEGVRFSTIFDERRCPLCSSRQGIIVSLDDFEGLAKLAIPVHPRCRCVWSPILKKDFRTIAAEPNRKAKDRKIIGGKTWLSGAIIAAILIPEELFALGLLGAAARNFVLKAGSLKLARDAIADSINGQGLVAPPAQPDTKIVKLLKDYKPEELKSFIPDLNNLQLQQISQIKNKDSYFLTDLKTILTPPQYLKAKKVFRENYLLELLSPKNNLNPSSLWINSGGIISRDKARDIYKLIKNKQFSDLADLMSALKGKGVDTDRLNKYAIDLFDRKYN